MDSPTQRRVRRLRQETILVKRPTKNTLLSTPMQVHCVFLFALSVSTRCVLAEDLGQSLSHTENGIKNMGDESYIIIAFSAFLAFCTLSVVATISYFSFLEDRLMKRYLEEGEVTEAIVVSAEFARGFKGAWGSSGNKADASATEYVLFVEYNKPIAQGSYMVRVRKQVKALADDVAWGRNGLVYSYSKNMEQADDLDSALQIQRMLRLLHDDEAARKGPDGLGKLDMLVLPEFHKSGVSRRQVERANGNRNMLSSMALVISGLGLSAFCVRLAAVAISNSQIADFTNADTNMVTLYMILSFAAMVILEVLLVHCCLRKTLEDALEEEYLQGGDLVPVDEDDSSLSTGSDFFLGKSLQANNVNKGGVGRPPNLPQNQTVALGSTVNVPSNASLYDVSLISVGDPSCSEW
jgi:hypothetical protein